MMKMRMGLLALMACFVAEASAAAVYRYSYTGNPLECSSTLSPFDMEYCEGGRGKVFSGDVIIDEALLPGGTLAGATVRLDYTLVSNDSSVAVRDVTTYTVTSEKGSFSGSRNNTSLGRFMQGIFSIFSFFGVSSDNPYGDVGIVGDTLFSVVEEGTGSFYELVFGSDRNIVGWTGDAGFTGGSGDFFTSSLEGDSMANGAMAAPGRWTLDSVVPAPGEVDEVSAVPLPAALPALLAALGVLAGLGRRRRRAV